MDWAVVEKLVEAPQCFKCQKPVEEVFIRRRPELMGLELGWWCHGTSEAVHMDISYLLTWVSQRSVLNQMAKMMARHLIVFLPDDGAELEREFNRCVQARPPVSS